MPGLVLGGVADKETSMPGLMTEKLPSVPVQGVAEIKNYLQILVCFIYKIVCGVGVLCVKRSGSDNVAR